MYQTTNDSRFTPFSSESVNSICTEEIDIFNNICFLMEISDPGCLSMYYIFANNWHVSEIISEG